MNPVLQRIGLVANVLAHLTCGFWLGQIAWRMWGDASTDALLVTLGWIAYLIQCLRALDAYIDFEQRRAFLRQKARWSL